MIKNMNWPNRISLIRIAFIPVVVAFLLVQVGEWNLWLAAVLFVAVAATDALDGYLARSRQEVTTFGKFLDPLADKLLVTAALVALVELGSIPAWIVIIIISREFIVSGLRMVAVVEDIVIAASNLGKWKTVFQMIAIVAFILKDTQTIQSLPEPLPMVLNIGSWIVMGLAVILTIWSGVDYLYNAREVLVGPWTSKETSQPEEG